MQSGCYVSRLHSIVSVNLLRRRICLFGSYECPIFQGNALGAFKEKRGINFLKQSTFFKIIPEKAERNHEVCLNKLLSVLLFKVQCRAPSLRRFFWRDPCGGPFLCCEHLFLPKGAVKAGVQFFAKPHILSEGRLIVLIKQGTF